MSKASAFILLHDYWHPRITIDPALRTIFPADQFDLTVTEEAADFLTYQGTPDLIVNFKDGIANTQIPTPNWYDDGRVGQAFRRAVESGTGFLGIHCGIANIPTDDAVYTDILKGRFLRHPPRCPVTFTPIPGHPITAGITEFTVEDEHYFINLNVAATNIIGYSSSIHGTNIALWAHEFGKGRVCGVTPGHTTEVLAHPQYATLLTNAARWCAKRI